MSLNWLETYSSKSTVRAYKWGLENFFKILGFSGSLEENAKSYFSQKSNYEEDLKTFLVNFKGRPPNSLGIEQLAAQAANVTNILKHIYLLTTSK